MEWDWGVLGIFVKIYLARHAGQHGLSKPYERMMRESGCRRLVSFADPGVTLILEYATAPMPAKKETRRFTRPRKVTERKGLL